MNPDRSPTAHEEISAAQLLETTQFVTVMVARQWFGVPVMQVQDILGPQRITFVPLAPPEISGVLNLRGRIVTAIDLRARLSFPARDVGVEPINVVVNFNDELYSLLADRVGEVVALPHSAYEPNPTTLQENWREVANGIYRREDGLLVVLDVARLLRLHHRSTVNA